jgi:hypothetical protein
MQMQMGRVFISFFAGFFRVNGLAGRLPVRQGTERLKKAQSVTCRQSVSEFFTPCQGAGNGHPAKRANAILCLVQVSVFNVRNKFWHLLCFAQRNDN